MFGLRKTLLFIMLSIAWAGSPAFSQDNELQKLMDIGLRPSANNTSLSLLRGEQKALSKIIDRLIEYREKQLAALNEKKRDLTERTSGEDVEILQSLLRNSRMELQKLRWDESAEAAMLEDLANEQSDPDVRQPATAIADLRQREKSLRSELETLQAQLATMGGEKSRDKLEQVAKVQRAQIQLNALSSEIYQQDEKIKTAALATIVESKRRLAQIRVRRKLLEEEIRLLSHELSELRKLGSEQWLIELDRKDLESLQSRLAPLQFRKLEVDALISAVEEK